MKRINRTDYLNWLLRWKEQQIIKVVTGVRRCGKSTLFAIFQDYLLQHGIAREQIISINFEDLDFEELTDYKALYQYGRMLPAQMNYVFLDEIQHVEHYQKAVDRYIRGLTDSLLFYEARRYNIKGKQLLTTMNKYYVCDIGMRNMLVPGREADNGHILENMVYLGRFKPGDKKCLKR